MNVLVLSASVGSGHTRAAEAVRAALLEEKPGAYVEHVDVLSLANGAFRAAYGRGYLGLAEAAPFLLGLIYEATDRGGARLSDGLRGLIQALGVRGLRALLSERHWDVVVNTHFLATELIAALKSDGRYLRPQLTVVTDFDAHRIWAHDPCEAYCVATSEAAGSLRRWGAAPETISVTGIPLMPVFSRLPLRSQALRAHELAGDRPVVLLLGGGSGMGGLEQSFERLLAVERPLDIVAVCGRNETARKRLSARRILRGHRARVLGFTDAIPALMTAADLVITKPGGLTVSEALACGTPVVVVNPIPGQETRNADYLLENGAGVKVNHLEALPEKVSALLADPARLGAMRAAARKLGRPVAAFDVARAALELARTAGRPKPSRWLEPVLTV